MNESQKQFRDRLLDAQQVNETLHEQYEKEIKAMFEETLTGAKRLMWLGAAVGGIFFLVLGGTLSIIVSKFEPGFPIGGRLIFGFGAVFGLGWAIVAGRIAWKGKLDRKVDANVTTGMSWAFVIIVTTIALVTSGRFSDPARGALMIVSCLAFLIPAAMFMISNRVDQAELRTREQLLEIKYRLAELAEDVTKQRRNLTANTNRSENG